MVKLNYLKQTVILLMIILLTGCSWFQRDVSTESGNELSNAFKSTNLTLKASYDTYYMIMETAGAAYKEGFLTEEQKDDIIIYGTIYKETHNKCVRALLD